MERPMRPLVVTLLMVSGACVCHAGSLPSVLDGNEVERRLPTANLPIDTYRPLPAGCACRPRRKQRLHGR